MGTGLEEKARFAKARGADTNVNICLFQQFSVFKKWWAKVEHHQQCGFAARILMFSTSRAIIDKDIGLQDSCIVDALFTRIWQETVASKGPSKLPERVLAPSMAAQKATVFETIVMKSTNVRNLVHGELQEKLPSARWNIMFQAQQP